MEEVEQLSPGGGREIVKILVGNKIDQPRVVSREQAEEWARGNGMLFLETSARTRAGIQQVFGEVVLKILENPILLKNTTPHNKAIKKIDLNNKTSNGTNYSENETENTCAC